MPERHDMDKKLEAAIAYLMTGSSVEAGKLCGVPDRTIRFWMHEMWWEDVLNNAKTVKQKELDAIWTGLIHKTADSLRDRLDKGDPNLMKDGTIKYVPIKAKDLALLMSIAVDKRALLRGQATSRRENVTIEQKFKELRQGFKDISVKEEETEEVIH